jgi:hypothetical protein
MRQNTLTALRIKRVDVPAVVKRAMELPGVDVELPESESGGGIIATNRPIEVASDNRTNAELGGRMVWTKAKGWISHGEMLGQVTGGRKRSYFFLGGGR